MVSEEEHAKPRHHHVARFFDEHHRFEVEHLEQWSEIRHVGKRAIRTRGAALKPVVVTGAGEALAPYKRIGNELEKLLDERKSLDAKITKLKEILERLRSLSKEERRKASLIDSNQEPISSLALTEAIRQILQRSGLAMLPRQVRDRLLMFECELPKQNPLAAIHGTLKRLQAKGEIEGIPQEDGKMTYRWITSVERALDSLSRN